MENTAFFGDVVLRFPRIVHHYFDRNSNWNLLIRWGIGFCNQSGVFDQGPHSPILSLVRTGAQDVWGPASRGVLYAWSLPAASPERKPFVVFSCDEPHGTLRCHLKGFRADLGPYGSSPDPHLSGKPWAWVPARRERPAGEQEAGEGREGVTSCSSSADGTGAGDQRERLRLPEPIQSGPHRGELWGLVVMSVLPLPS